MEDKHVEVNIEHIKDLQFKVTFESVGFEMLMDEPEPIGSNQGPNPSQILSAAIGNCLSASLMFCLKKARAEINGLKTKIKTKIIRTDKGRMRIGGSTVEIVLDVNDGQESRLGHCLDLFEDYCIVTQSVRDGIDVDVQVKNNSGEILFDSSDRHK
ncbi:MAG: OsmC family protein [bacterium]